MNFDSFLNTVVPFLVVIVGFYLLYRPLKEPIDNFFGWIKGLFSGKDKDIQDETPENRSIDYI